MNFEKVKYSVIIPTYNRGDLILKLLNKLAKQTFKNFEVLICDDGSTDDTKMQIELFKGDIAVKYIYSDNSGGPAAPRNIGIKNASGEYCAFLDSDDYWYENKLAVIDNAIEEGYDWVYHDLDILVGGKIEAKYNVREYDKENALFDLLYNFNPIATSGIVIKKSVLEENGFFNESADYHFVEDFDYWLRLVQRNVNSKAINISLGVYNDHELNNSKSLEQIKKVNDLYIGYSNKLKQNSRVILAGNYAQFCLAAKMVNNVICKQIMLNMLKINPFHKLSIKAFIKYYKSTSLN